MYTILNKLLLDYAGTLEIEYLGKRCAKIKFMGRCKKSHLERKLTWWLSGSHDRHYIDWIDDFNCNGIWTTATIRLLPTSKPFYEDGTQQT
jgi:hypothetical protein